MGRLAKGSALNGGHANQRGARHGLPEGAPIGRLAKGSHLITFLLY